MIAANNVTRRIATFQRNKKPTIGCSPGFLKTSGMLPVRVPDGQIYLQSRTALSNNVHHKQGHQDYKNQQNDVFEIPQYPITGETVDFFEERDFVA